MTYFFLRKKERKKVLKFWIENQIFASWELLSWQRHSEFSTSCEQLTIVPVIVSSSAVTSNVCRWVWYLVAILFLIPLFHSFFSVCHNISLLLGICNESVQLCCSINRKNTIWAVQVLYLSVTINGRFLSDIFWFQGEVKIQEQSDKLFPIWFSVWDC